MRKLLYAFGLTSALVFALAAQAAAPNFAGTWTLDKSKSQGLSQRVQNAESVSWVITQTDKDITIEEKIAGGGGPGGPAVALRLVPSCWCSSCWCSSSGRSGRWSWSRRNGRNVVVRAPTISTAVRLPEISGAPSSRERRRCPAMARLSNCFRRRLSRHRMVTRSRAPRVTSSRFQPMAKC